MNYSWEKLSEEHTRVGYRRLIIKTFRLPDGATGEYVVRDEGRAACIVGITPEQKVILTRVYRPGYEKLVTELPGGWIEEGEDPAKGAARELLEETGYAGDLEFVGTSLEDAYSNLIRYNYVARNCRKVAEPAGDDDEFSETILMSLEEFRAHLRSGDLSDVETGYLGLDYLGLL